MNDLIEKSLRELSESLAVKFDDKIKEACNLWGVDLSDDEEIRKRCVIVQKPHKGGVELFGYDKVKEFHIDGKLVMMFTEWEIDDQPINAPFKVTASFRCSEIAKPY